MTEEQYVNHEVRIQLVENAIIKLSGQLDLEFKSIHDDSKSLRQEMRSDFKWLMGSILGLSAILISFLGSIALHAMKLV